MTTEDHCPDLSKLDPVKAIRAIHEAWLQISSMDRRIDTSPYDNRPVLRSLSDCLADAGHPGFPRR